MAVYLSHDVHIRRIQSEKSPWSTPISTPVLIPSFCSSHGISPRDLIGGIGFGNIVDAVMVGALWNM